MMNLRSLIFLATSLAFSTNVNAALVERANGLAYYDTESDLTWLADANISATLGAFTNGTIQGDYAISFLNIFNGDDWYYGGSYIDGVNDWRLPTTTWPDESCSNYSSWNNYLNCSGSELGNLFYNVLGNNAGSLENTGPFVNVQSEYYWTSTPDENAPDTYSWAFDMGNGEQYSYNTLNEFHVWFVRDGDIAELSSVPIPAAVWLFGSGLIGLVGLARRKKA